MEGEEGVEGEEGGGGEGKNECAMLKGLEQASP